ncbi:MAG: hypothetical protein FJ387_15565 [Verrucomicrobia bacterium]|nr:hypothetical protein [Verrucomicrobiota bacterium]
MWELFNGRSANAAGPGQGCGLCLFALRPQDAAPERRSFARCPRCERVYHADCARDDCPICNSQPEKLESLAAWSVARAAPLDTRKRIPILPALPPPVSPPPPPPCRPRPVRWLLKWALLWSLLGAGLLALDVGDLSGQPEWLQETNRRRLEYRVRVQENLRAALVKVTRFCDRAIQVLSPASAEGESSGSE